MKPTKKTPDYTLRAAKNYRDKHDFMHITFEKGEPDLFRSVGITPAVVRELVRAEFERRNAEIKPENDKSGKPTSEMTDDEKLDFFNV